MAEKSSIWRDLNGGQDPSALEELVMLKLLLVGGLAVVGSIFTAATWGKVLAWLVEHQVLVSAKESPLVPVPAGDGSGLDLPRLALLAVGVLFAGYCGVAALRRRAAKRREEHFR